jgi:hypothetical protein
MWHVRYVVCIRETGRDYLLVVYVWKRGTGIVMGVLGNGVLRALLGFMERNY